MPAHAPLLTRATWLSLARLALVPPLYLAIRSDAPVVATAIFWLAVASDFADGWVARRFDQVTPLGGTIDHSVDAIFVATGVFALAQAGVLPLPLAPVILLAFAQYALDSRSFAGQALRPSRLGRWNGIAYYVAVAVPIIRDALGLSWPGPGFVLVGGWLLVASTFLSMLNRFWSLVLARRAPDSPDAGTPDRSPR